MKLVYGVKDKPKFGQLIVFAIQQLLAIMAATLVVPVIINGNAGLSGGDSMSTAAALFGAGVGTLVYVLFTKAKSPVFLGSSFAFIGSMTAAFAGAATVAVGYLGLIIGAFFAGLVYVIIALVIKFAGVNWLNRIMPAVVIGPTVAIIGLSLAGNAIGDLNKTNYVTTHNPDFYSVAEVGSGYTVDQDGNYNFTADSATEYFVVDKNVDISAPVAPENIHTEITATRNDDGSFSLTSTPGSHYVAIICGLFTLLVTVICSTYGKNMTKLIPFIIGICSGYVLAGIFYIIGSLTNNPALMIVDYSPLKNLFANGVQVSSFLTFPKFTFLTAFGGFSKLSLSYISTIAVAYVPVAFVVFAEHIADHKNISSIIETDLLEEPGLSRTLLGDGVGSMAGAFFGGCPNTTYGESVACVAITGNASVATIIAAAIGAILISFLAPFVAFVNSIPSCVMGGVCMALYGFIAVSGLKMIQKVDLNQNRNLFVVSAILIAGIGGLSITFGQVTLTSIATALILGIIVNVVLSKEKAEEVTAENKE